MNQNALINGADKSDLKPFEVVMAPIMIGPMKKWKAKVSFIHKMWMQPCGVNPTMWVLGYFAASPVLLVALFQPDCLDSAYHRIRGGHGKRRTGWSDIADYIKPIAPPTEGWQRVGFDLSRLAQRIGLYLLLVDATMDWVIHGTSLAYRWSGCDDPNQGHASCEMKNAVPALFPAGEGIIGSWSRVNSHIFIAGPTGIGVPKGHASGCGFGITQHMGHFDPLPDAQVELALYDRKSQQQAPWEPIERGPDGRWGLTFWDASAGFSEPGAEYVVRYRKTAGAFYCDGTMAASGTNLTGVSSSFCGASALKE